MGQKVNPIGLRLGINRTWDSRWFARKGDYARLLHEDVNMRKVLKQVEKVAPSDATVPGSSHIPPTCSKKSGGFIMAAICTSAWQVTRPSTSPAARNSTAASFVSPKTS